MQGKSKIRRPEREYLPAATGSSLRLFYSQGVRACEMRAWHYHPEIEMVYVPQGKGNAFVADSVMPYEDGFIILMHSNLPHFCFDYGFEGKVFEQYVVQILPETFEKMITLPEFKPIQQKIEASQSGLFMQPAGQERSLFYDLFQRLFAASPFEQILLFLEILHRFSSMPLETVATAQRPPMEPAVVGRLEKVYDFIAQNYAHHITSRDAARLVHFTDASFCRFFQKNTQKTFKETLIEYRLAQACRLLAHTDQSVESIAQDTGFYSHSFFNRIFKREKGVTPLVFRRDWHQGNTV